MGLLVTDEIIDEIHTIRHRHSASLDFDIELIIADLKKSEKISTENGWPLAQAQEEKFLKSPLKLNRFQNQN